jgi:hypothetical protein
MLAPKVGSKVNDLPNAQGDQHPHGANCKPLDPLVSALIRITQLHLAPSQKVHLIDDLLGHLTQPLQLRLHRAQLLAGLNGAPIFGVGADIDVEFDGFLQVRGGVGLRGQDVLEADVEGAVGEGVEGSAGLAGDVARLTVVVAEGVFDLHQMCEC